MNRDHVRTARPTAKLVQGRRDWYSITNQADETVDLFIYDEIGYFGVTASDMIGELLATNAKTINVRINSPGGDAFDGVAIYNALKMHQATVNVTVDSLAASAASFIAMAGDTVTMQPNAQMMIHDASGICIGNATDMQKMVDLLGACSNNIASIYAAKAGGSVEDWRAAMQDETWYTAQEAVAAGLADKVGVYAGKEPAASNDWDLSIYAYAGREHAPAPKVTNERGTMEWDWVTHPSDSKSGTCEQCDDLAAKGPYPKGSEPELPAHPNCECTLEPIRVIRLITETRPTNVEPPEVEQAPEVQSAPRFTQEHADAFRRAMLEAVAS